MTNNLSTWLEYKGLDSTSEQELKALQNESSDSGKIDDLLLSFSSFLSFGTSGLRAKMGLGTNKINIYTIRHASQSIANVLNNTLNSIGKTELNIPTINIAPQSTKSVVIGYDSRNNGKVFANETAKVFLKNGFTVYLFSQPCPTPQVSFAIRKLGADIGINITASHNTKEYNGYKVYGADGGQITGKMANIIAKEMESLHIFNAVHFLSDQEFAYAKGLTYLGEDMDNAYMQAVIETVLTQKEEKNSKTNLGETKLNQFTSNKIKTDKNLNIIYTPFHGVAGRFLKEIFKKNGFAKAIPVPEQFSPNGDFPTLKSPNPENEEGFSLAIDQATRKNADLILAIDPDGDRVGVMVKQYLTSNTHTNANISPYKLLTGNQVGILLTYFLLKLKEENQCLNENSFVVKSLVSSKMINQICAIYGTKVIEVLTGFKYIGEKISELPDSLANDFVFGFEESCGYLTGTYARDKDAILASLLIAEMGDYYKKQGLTLLDVLDFLYKKLGYHKEKTLAITLDSLKGLEKIKEIMNYFRSSSPSDLNKIFCNYADINSTKDYLSSEAFDIKKGNSTNIDLPKENMLSYQFKDESFVIIRPSGTEPKLKIYLMIMADNEFNADVKLAKLEQLIIEAISKF